MKIMHCCLAAFYIDNFSYQENIFPKIHKIQGHDVRILASTENYINNSQLGYVLPGQYMNENNILVTRIPYVKWLPHAIAKKLRIYKGILKCLEQFEPDLIYLHDCQFISIIIFSEYAKKHNVKIIVDSHTDFVNSGKSWISKNILHKIVYKWCAKRIEKYTSIFYATLPIRAEFLKDIYGIAENKIKLLPFGTDDSLFNPDDKDQIRSITRQHLGIKAEDFVIVSGGKIDERKNIAVLLKSFIEIQNENSFPNFKVLIFGKPVEALKEEILTYANHQDVIYIEWAAAKDIHKYFLAADLAFFPGTHSVLWEEAVGLGLPSIFKKWNGITHVDLGGNCLFLENPNEEIIKQTLLKIVANKIGFQEMKQVAQEFGPTNFSYSAIAYQAIN